MVSKTKLRKYKSKKYANTLKNKKKSKMKGGSSNPGSIRQRKPLSFTFPTPIERKLMQLFETAQPLEEVKDYISNIFRKFKYSYDNTNPAYKENEGYLYIKKDEVDKPINLTEVYKVYAPNNQSISIEHKISKPSDEKYKEMGKLYDITPLELSVDTMQLAVNTGKLEMSTDKEGNSYLGFVDFPSLVITEKHAGSGFSYTSREYANWISVYEEKFEDNEKLFDLIKTNDGRHIDKNTLDLEIKIMEDKIHILKANKRNSDIEKIEELNVKIGELNTAKNKPVINMSNEALFIMKQNEMRTLLEGEKTLDIDEKEIEKQKIVEQVKYRAYVSLEGEENSGDIGNKNVLTENIGWAMQNALWLEQYLKIKTEDNRLTAQELKSKIGEEYECDLSGLDEKYIIVDDETCPGYVICGYPDKNMKEMIINFWQNQIYNNDTETGYLNKVHEEQKTNNSKWFIDLFNEFKKLKKNPIPIQPYTEGDIYISLRDGVFKYIENRYDELYSNVSNGLDAPEYINFKSNFIKNAKEYFQKIGEQYLPKPITKIKYVFLVFTKNKNNNSLEPFIFNLKELTKHHEPILKQIERLIKHKLSYRFGILSDNEYNNKKGNDTNPFDDEYKLWYSQYRYGEFFHISTEYIHSMSNISDKAHGYKNSITLEELKYSCILNSDKSKKNSFINNIRIDYEIREYKINNLNKFKKNSNNKKEQHKNDCSQYKVGSNSESRSDLVFCLYEKKKLTEKSKITEKQKKIVIHEHFKNIKLILMYKTHQQTYTFILSYEGKFYKLVISSNISNIINDIIIELNTKILSNSFDDMTIKFKGKTNIFRIVSYDILDIPDYKLIFKLNPLIVKDIKKIDKKSLLMDMNYHISTNLLAMTPSNVLLYNLYHDSKYRPMLIDNILQYMQQNPNFKCNVDNVKYEIEFKGCANKKCEDPEINCIYYNQGGYDFIESIDNDDNKIIVYVIPNNYNKPGALKYLGNFLDLDESSKEMLHKIKKIYSNENNMVFLHAAFNPKFYCLHFHILRQNKQSKYKRDYDMNEGGTFLQQDMYIDTVINNLEINNNYYKDLNFNLIKSY